MDPNYYNSVEGWFDYTDVYDRAVAEAPHGAIFVELGVSLGKSAIYLASRIMMAGKDIKLYCVDCWDLPVVIQNGVVILSSNPEDTKYHPDGNYEQFLINVKNAGVESVVIPLKAMTTDAAKQFADESIDFVFFDASHAFEPVLADLKAWIPKIKMGKFYGGHDYDASEKPGPSTGGLGPWNVSRAVHEYLGRAHIAQSGNSWWTIKR